MDILLEGISQLSLDFADSVRSGNKNNRQINDTCNKHLESVGKLMHKFQLPDFKAG